MFKVFPAVLLWTRDRLEVHDGVTELTADWPLSARWELDREYLSSPGLPDLRLVLLLAWRDPPRLPRQLGLRRNISQQEPRGVFIATAGNQDSPDWEVEPLSEENQCIACRSSSNTCSRFVAALLSQVVDNRGLTECGEPRDGEWSGWAATEPCRPWGRVNTTVSIVECGEGYQQRRRNCTGRTYGGKYCEIDQNYGKGFIETIDKFQTQVQDCFGKPCPGMK